MRIHLLASLFVLVFVASCSGGSTSHSGSFANSAAAGRYIVGLTPGATAGTAASLAASQGIVPEHVYSRVFNGFAGQLTASQAASLRANPSVRFVEPDLVAIATPPGGGGKPGGGGGGGGGGDDTIPWGVDKMNANDNTGPGGAGVAVAIFDTGVDLDHPDLGDAVIASFDATGGTSADDKNGHGTHVAGIVGARDNGFGYVGVAPQCNIVAVKVLGNSGSGYISWIVAGIEWATLNRQAYNIGAGNMSLGASGSSQALADAITAATAAGIIFAVSAGNSGANAGNYIPASYSNVICVSALDPDYTWAYYSNYGSVVDVIAPGTNVPSLWKGGGYKTISGTSMASPHVAGAIALWLDDNFDNDPNTNHASDFTSVRNKLREVPPGLTNWTGGPADGETEPLPIVAGY